MARSSAPPKDVVDALLDAATDPPNRLYRYPAARALLPILGRIPWLTPNHVTYVHIVFGLVAAGLVAFTEARIWLLVAFVASEIRMILDCFDGVLARAKGSSSPFGRALDEIADTIAAITMACAFTHRLQLGGTGVFVACAMLAIGGLCANAWDFYKRKLQTALKDDKDGPFEELRQKKALIEGGKGTLLGYWGVYFDCFQVLLYEVRPENGDAVGVIRRRAASPGMRRFAGLLGFLSFDNGLTIMHLGVLTGLFFETELFIVAYAFCMWITTMIGARVVLRDVEAEALA
ncbi:MAG: CDP-alcohol phosphatidyltransferase family protein [Labilithrix sp.]|nr:CDP-alcohol phosphatidyltransferase family protein [Labilithrix sp.]MCW5812401.1 CDP-alcohol phosphatidyltransferase family protein [Labilithrix sp.]